MMDATAAVWMERSDIVIDGWMYWWWWGVVDDTDDAVWMDRVLLTVPS